MKPILIVGLSLIITGAIWLRILSIKESKDMDSIVGWGNFAGMIYFATERWQKVKVPFILMCLGLILILLFAVGELILNK